MHSAYHRSRVLLFPSLEKLGRDRLWIYFLSNSERKRFHLITSSLDFKLSQIKLEVVFFNFTT